ncbi:MAG: AMP-binding protein [Burkholderiales bacterium]|nr:AMP-binding protein [Burkholderiales bacterium]
MLDGCTPWPQEAARQYRARGYWQGITLDEMLRRSARRRPDALAIVDGARSATYAQLAERVDRLAANLADLELRSRERVVFQLGNSIEFVYAFFALMRIGVIPVMALPGQRLAEIRRFAQHAQAVAYLIPDDVNGFDYRALARAVQAEAPSVRLTIAAGGGGKGVVGLDPLLSASPSEATLARLRAAPACDPDDVALMILSGGTTGLPKLIPRIHDDYVYNCKQSGAVAGFGPDTVYLALLPMAHNYSLASPGILAALAHGGRVVVAPDARAETVFPLIEKEAVTVVCGGVPLAANWLASDWPERCDLSSLRVYMNGGARLLPELRRRIEARFGCTYVESYGTGEGLLNQTRLDDPDEIRFGSSGRPVSEADEIRVIDTNGNDVPDGCAGELVARGPYTFRGYYTAPEATAAAFTPDGFYRMGDVVRRIDGYLYVEGRIKDLINRGGEKVSSEEVEGHLVAHPSVRNACVVAMPDPVYGERACAFVIPRDGATLDIESMKAFLIAQGIAKFKLPERLELVDSFPLSPAGKILRRELRATIAAKLEAELGEAASAGSAPSAEKQRHE